MARVGESRLLCWDYALTSNKRRWCELMASGMILMDRRWAMRCRKETRVKQNAQRKAMRKEWKCRWPLIQVVAVELEPDQTKPA